MGHIIALPYLPWIYLFECLGYKPGCLPSMGRPQTQQHQLPHRFLNTTITFQSHPCLSLLAITRLKKSTMSDGALVHAGQGPLGVC